MGAIRPGLTSAVPLPGSSVNIIDKIGFLVHEPVLWAHYSNVWKELGRDAFSIVLTERFRNCGGSSRSHGAAAFMEKATVCDYDLVWANDLLETGRKYKYLVSNHKISGRSMHPL